MDCNLIIGYTVKFKYDGLSVERFLQSISIITGLLLLVSAVLVPKIGDSFIYENELSGILTCYENKID